MRRAGILAAALAAAAAATGLAVASLPLFYEKGPINIFGYITAVTPKGHGYQLRFDPAFFLTGVTASVAAVEDKAIRPGDAVPNDYYVRNPEHSLLTFKLPAKAPVTILVNLGTTKVTVAALANLLDTVKGCGGKYALHLPCRLGFWLSYSGDTVKSLDQQYQP